MNDQNNGSPKIKAPSNAQFVELSLSDIHEGRLIQGAEEALAKMLADFSTYEQETGDLQNKCQLTIEIQVKRTKREGAVDITHQFKAKTPNKQDITSHNFAGGKLLGLHDPSAYTDTNKKQLTFFNREGEARLKINTETGEPIEDDVAGKIESA